MSKCLDVKKELEINDKPKQLEKHMKFNVNEKVRVKLTEPHMGLGFRTPFETEG